MIRFVSVVAVVLAGCGANLASPALAETVVAKADVGHVDKQVSMTFALLTKPCSGIGVGCGNVPTRFGMTRTIVPALQ